MLHLMFWSSFFSSLPPCYQISTGICFYLQYFIVPSVNETLRIMLGIYFFSLKVLYVFFQREGSVSRYVQNFMGPWSLSLHMLSCLLEAESYYHFCNYIALFVENDLLQKVFKNIFYCSVCLRLFIHFLFRIADGSLMQ